MAIGAIGDMEIYEVQFYAGMFETLERNVNAFNAASGGAIRQIAERAKGQFIQESFFKVPVNFIVDRDPTAVTAATSTKLVQDELKSPKSDKTIGPVDNTFDSFKKIGRSISEMAFILGQQAGPEVQGVWLESALSALIGTFSVTGVATALVTDATTASLNSDVLNTGLSKIGDAHGRVKLWVMHSKPYFDLIGNQVAAKLLEVTAFALNEGTPATYGIPVLVVDSPALFAPTGSSVASTDDVFWTFGLVDGAVTTIESEERSIVIEAVTGLKNLVMRYQGEFSYNTSVKGMAWKTAVSPTDAVLAAATNWEQAAADKRSLPGVAIKTR